MRTPWFSRLVLLISLCSFSVVFGCDGDDGEESCVEGAACSCPGGLSGVFECTSDPPVCHCEGSDVVLLDMPPTDLGDISDVADTMDVMDTTDVTDTDAGDTDATDAMDVTDTADVNLNNVDCTDPGTWPAGWIAMETEALNDINALRTTGTMCGSTMMPAVGPVTLDPALTQAARCHVQDMAENNYFDFINMQGDGPSDRVLAAGFTGMWYQGNIGSGVPRGAQMVANWQMLEATCINMMVAAPDAIGVGVFDTNSDAGFRFYWDLELGARP